MPTMVLWAKDKKERKTYEYRIGRRARESQGEGGKGNRADYPNTWSGGRKQCVAPRDQQELRRNRSTESMQVAAVWRASTGFLGVQRENEAGRQRCMGDALLLPHFLSPPPTACY
ncbi:unnamed protein product [Pleuronectes platessa]|uniref:Uncharacterized protein n=1 Tax=Pleuronectes platessa TaxID=8262 RepID=A0A9N7YWA4_PLEPL|nr:unnamed protein product [Pleuronectes platessa]